MNRENLARGLSKGEVEGLRQEAWLGDAVLELYVREQILKVDAARNDARRISLVRNSFLNRLGQPTRVEAQIGRIYQQEGLQAAYAWIASELGGMMEAIIKSSAAAAPQKRPGRRSGKRA